MNLNQYLLTLSEACDQLKTHDELRNAELANIATVIEIIREQLKKKEVTWEAVGEDIAEVSRRLNTLATNPEWAGNHEHHRVTIIPESG